MRIELYFERTRKVIDACPILQSSNVAYDKRGTYEGYIRGELYFVDNSILHVREYVDVEIEIERINRFVRLLQPRLWYNNSTSKIA